MQSDEKSDSPSNASDTSAPTTENKNKDDVSFEIFFFSKENNFWID